MSASPDILPSALGARASEPDHPAPAGDAPCRSAAAAVYRIPEVLENILAFMDDSTLAICMRVEKKGIYGVARMLYDVIKWEMIRNFLQRREDWHPAVCRAVSEINVQGPHQSRMMERDLSYPPDKHLIEFQPDLFESFVPGLRDRCPNISLVWLGAEYSPLPFAGESWEIVLDPSYISSPTPEGTINHDIGIAIIRIFRSSTCSLHRPPPRSFDALSVPMSADYIKWHIVNVRFDLHLTSLEEDDEDYLSSPSHPSTYDQWLSAFREDPQFKNLYEVVDFADLPIALPDITAIIQRQLDAGHSDHTLSRITAQNIMEWTIPDFEAFAKLASSHLTWLLLGDDYRSPHCVTLADLPAITSLIHNHLTSLERLSLPLRDSYKGDIPIGESLNEDSLCETGTIEQLDIYLDGEPGDLLNTVRCLYRVCAEDAALAIHGTDEDPEYSDWSISALAKFLHYLQKQSPSRRKHLATVDFFETLDIEMQEDIEKLSYHPDGRPKRMYESKAEAWASEAKAAVELTSALIPKLQAELLDLSTKADRVQAIMAAGLTGPEARREALELAEVMARAKKAAREISEAVPMYSGTVAAVAGTLAPEIEERQRRERAWDWRRD